MLEDVLLLRDDGEGDWRPDPDWCGSKCSEGWFAKARMRRSDANHTRQIAQKSTAPRKYSRNGDSEFILNGIPSIQDCYCFAFPKMIPDIRDASIDQMSSHSHKSSKSDGPLTFWDAKKSKSKLTKTESANLYCFYSAALSSLRTILQSPYRLVPGK
jgi:hypothetical protein